MKRRYNPNRNRRKGTSLKKSRERLKKKVHCNYCGDEIETLVNKKAKGPFYHNDLCEQAWESEQSGGPVLASSKNYHDIEDDTLWRELSYTKTESAEDALHNMLSEKRIEGAKRKGYPLMGWQTPRHTAFSYNHKGDTIHSAVNKEALSERLKIQQLSVLWLRSYLRR